MDKNSLITFPCDFPVKIVGSNSDSFREEIKGIVTRHFPGFNDDSITFKKSKAGNYLSITVVVYAENQDMLNGFYSEISKHPGVKMAL